MDFDAARLPTASSWVYPTWSSWSGSGIGLGFSWLLAQIQKQRGQSRHGAISLRPLRPLDMVTLWATVGSACRSLNNSFCNSANQSVATCRFSPGPTSITLNSNVSFQLHALHVPHAGSRPAKQDAGDESQTNKEQCTSNQDEQRAIKCVLHVHNHWTISSTHQIRNHANRRILFTKAGPLEDLLWSLSDRNTSSVFLNFSLKNCSRCCLSSLFQPRWSLRDSSPRKKSIVFAQIWMNWASQLLSRPRNASRWAELQAAKAKACLASLLKDGTPDRPLDKLIGAKLSWLLWICGAGQINASCKKGSMSSESRFSIRLMVWSSTGKTKFPIGVKKCAGVQNLDVEFEWMFDVMSDVRERWAHLGSCSFP